MSMDGNYLVAGDPERNDYTGAVVIFKLDNDEWNQLGATLYGSQAKDEFGVCVEITGDGESAFVGADQTNVNGGAGYVSHLNLSTNQDWMIKSNFTDNNPDSEFGNTLSVASDGSRLILGSSSADNNGDNSGSAYVYTLLPEASLLQRIDGDESNDLFGLTTTMSGDGSCIAVTSSNSGTSFVKVFSFDETSNSYKFVGDRIDGQNGTYLATPLLFLPREAGLPSGQYLMTTENLIAGKHSCMPLTTTVLGTSVRLLVRLLVIIPAGLWRSRQTARRCSSELLAMMEVEPAVDM